MRARRSVPCGAALEDRAACAPGVHFLSPMPAPARCTTASTPSSPAASMVPASGSQRDVVRPLGCATHQAHDAVAVGPESREERRADESMGSGHEHVHAGPPCRRRPFTLLGDAPTIAGDHSTKGSTCGPTTSCTSTARGSQPAGQRHARGDRLHHRGVFATIPAGDAGRHRPRRRRGEGRVPGVVGDTGTRARQAPAAGGRGARGAPRRDRRRDHPRGRHAQASCRRDPGGHAESPAFEDAAELATTFEFEDTATASSCGSRSVSSAASRRGTTR